MQRIPGNPAVFVVEKKSNPLGTAAFVLALVSILSLGILAPVSLILSIVAMQKQPKDLAVAGLVLSLVMVIPAVLVVFFVVGVAGAVGSAASAARDSAARQQVTQPVGNLVCRDVRQLRGQVEMIAKNDTAKPVSKVSMEIVVTDKNGEIVAKDVVSARIPDAIRPGESRRLYFAPQYDSQLKPVWPETATATAKVLTTD